MRVRGAYFLLARLFDVNIAGLPNARLGSSIYKRIWQKGHAAQHSKLTRRKHGGGVRRPGGIGIYAPPCSRVLRCKWRVPVYRRRFGILLRRSKLSIANSTDGAFAGYLSPAFHLARVVQ